MRGKATHRGACSSCERLVVLRRDGVLQTHWRDGTREEGACAGSGRRPLHGTVALIGAELPSSPRAHALLEQLELGIVEGESAGTLLAICEQLGGQI